MRALLRNLLVVFCLSVFAPGLGAQENYPTTKAAWIDRFARIHSAIGEDYGAMYHLAQGDDELMFQVLSDGWTRFTGDGVKNYLLAVVMDGKAARLPEPVGKPVEYKPNPHLLEILHLGMTDPKGDPQYAARHHLFGIAFVDFYDQPRAYEAWYREANGKPLDTVIRAGMADYITRLERADEPTKKRMLDLGSEIPFKSGMATTTDGSGRPVTTVQATGLTGLRRKIALEAGLLDKWMEIVVARPGLDVGAGATINVMNFMPDQNFLEARQDDLLGALASISSRPRSNYYFSSGSYLGAFHARRAVDLLRRRLIADFQTDGFGGLMNSLPSVTDPRIIPTLIVLLETGEMESWHEQQAEAALRRLGGPSAVRNMAGWREWWTEHANELPAEVRAMSFPHLVSAAEQANAVMVRRQVVQIHIAGDPKRSYLLLTPGLLLPRAPQPGAAADGRPFVAEQDRPGLLVVLSDTDPTNRAVQDFWQQAVTRAFSSKYLIAVALAPKWGAEKPFSWVTGMNRLRTPVAQFTVETFAADIVADIIARYPIQSAHIFLHGEGTGGLAAYSCSLQPQTPFRGFSMLAAEFHSAQLPPTEAARGRRYYLEASKADKTPPYFLTTSAQSLLTKAGATVALIPVPGDHTPRFTTETVDLLAKAVRWLENGK